MVEKPVIYFFTVSVWVSSLFYIRFIMEVIVSFIYLELDSDY